MLGCKLLFSVFLKTVNSHYHYLCIRAFNLRVRFLIYYFILLVISFRRYSNLDWLMRTQYLPYFLKTERKISILLITWVQKSIFFPDWLEFIIESDRQTCRPYVPSASIHSPAILVRKVLYLFLRKYYFWESIIFCKRKYHFLRKSYFM